MIIKFCPNCKNKPYTTDIEISSCPNCSSPLTPEFINNTDVLVGRPILNTNIQPQNNNYSNDFPVPTSNDFANPVPVSSKPSDVLHFTKSDSTVPVNFGKASAVKNCVIKGSVSGYSSSGNEDGSYRRLFPVKIYEALVYKQRLEDVLHRFTVRVHHNQDIMGFQNYTDIPVNVHGTIAGGMKIIDNTEVEIEGKYRNGVFMASRIDAINNGYKSKIHFQRSIKTIVYSVLSVISAILILFFAGNSTGDFLENLKTFGKIWIIFAVIVTILYLISLLTKISLLMHAFSSKKKHFPFFGVFLTSLILTFLFILGFGQLFGFVLTI